MNSYRFFLISKLFIRCAMPRLRSFCSCIFAVMFCHRIFPDHQLPHQDIAETIRDTQCLHQHFVETTSNLQATHHKHDAATSPISNTLTSTDQFASNSTFANFFPKSSDSL